MQIYCPNCHSVHEISYHTTVLGGVKVLVIKCCGCDTNIYISAINS